MRTMLALVDDANELADVLGTSTTVAGRILAETRLEDLLSSRWGGLHDFLLSLHPPAGRERFYPVAWKPDTPGLPR